MLPRWAIAAAGVLAVAAGGYDYRWRRGEAAKREVLLAFRITATKVNQSQNSIVAFQLTDVAGNTTICR